MRVKTEKQMKITMCRFQGQKGKINFIAFIYITSKKLLIFPMDLITLQTK